VYITGDEAARVLGWKPETSLRDGLERTVAHIRAASA
jgi:nucleoside-diphosphate-sugar epimerase